jgi:hypothetical protein
MSSIHNTAAWLPGVGKRLDVSPSEIPVPGENELLIEVSQAMAWKLVRLNQGLKHPRHTRLVTDILRPTGKGCCSSASRVQDPGRYPSVSTYIPHDPWT